MVLLTTALDTIETEIEPKRYNQAIDSPEYEKWKVAMDQELDALYTQNTWDVVPEPKSRKIVGSRWVFKLKRDALGKTCRYKARLVAQGFS